MTTATQLFAKAGGAVYGKFRPVYPPKLYDLLYAFVGEHRQTAVDVGCGSGQATHVLGETFANVLGIDPSAAQIDEANKSNKHPDRVSFVIGEAHQIPKEAKTVDLVTCAQAMHWLEEAVVVPEVKRVLKDSGVFAIFCYPCCTSPVASVNALIHEYYFETLGPWWHPNRKLLDNEYSHLNLNNFFSTVERHDILDHKKMSIGSFVGYMKTSSARQTMLDAKQSDPVPQLRQRLIEAIRRDTTAENKSIDDDDELQLDVDFKFILWLNKGKL